MNVKCLYKFDYIAWIQLSILREITIKEAGRLQLVLTTCHLPEIMSIQSACICDSRHVLNTWTSGVLQCLSVRVVAMVVSFSGKDRRRCTSPRSLFCFPWHEIEWRRQSITSVNEFLIFLRVCHRISEKKEGLDIWFQMTVRGGSELLISSSSERLFDWPLDVPLLMDSLHLSQAFFFFFLSHVGLSSICKLVFYFSIWLSTKDFCGFLRFLLYDLG